MSMIDLTIPQLPDGCVQKALYAGVSVGMDFVGVGAVKNAARLGKAAWQARAAANAARTAGRSGAARRAGARALRNRTFTTYEAGYLALDHTTDVMGNVIVLDGADPWWSYLPYGGSYYAVRQGMSACRS